MYKYTKIDYAESIILEKYLWFSHIDKLNDPFECDIHRVEYTGMDYEEDKHEYLREQRNMAYLKKMPQNHFFGYPDDDMNNRRITDEINKYYEIFAKYEKERERIIILSLSQTNLSPAMWSHYGDGFKGICLKIDREDLEKSLTLNGYNWKCIKVKYSDKRPELKYRIKDDIEILVSHKHSDWSYEKEIRYAIWTKKEELAHNDKGLRIPIGNALLEIDISLNTERKKLEKILTIYNKSNVKIIRFARRGWLEESKLPDAW